MSFGFSWPDISAAISNQAFRNEDAVLAYSLHKKSLAITEVEEFDGKVEVKTIAKVDGIFGENLLRFHRCNESYVLTSRSTGLATAFLRRASFHSRPAPSLCRKPVNSNVRPLKSRVLERTDSDSLLQFLSKLDSRRSTFSQFMNNQADCVHPRPIQEIGSTGLHDATLAEVTLDWIKAEARLSVQILGGRSATLAFHGVTSVVVPRAQPWGPSNSINSANTVAAGEYALEMQSGDVLLFKAASWSLRYTVGADSDQIVVAS